MRVSASLAAMYVHQVYAWCQPRSEEGMGSPETSNGWLWAPPPHSHFGWVPGNKLRSSLWGISIFLQFFLLSVLSQGLAELPKLVLFSPRTWDPVWTETQPLRHHIPSPRVSGNHHSFCFSEADNLRPFMSKEWCSVSDGDQLTSAPQLPFCNCRRMCWLCSLTA